MGPTREDISKWDLWSSDRLQVLFDELGIKGKVKRAFGEYDALKRGDYKRVLQSQMDRRREMKRAVLEQVESTAERIRAQILPEKFPPDS